MEEIGNRVDVKNIFDIPEINKFRDELFEFNCFSFSDNIRCFDLTEKRCVTIKGLYNCKVSVLLITDEDLICNEEKLIDLATDGEISYFSMVFYDFITEELICSYSYRPLINESEKKY